MSNKSPLSHDQQRKILLSAPYCMDEKLMMNTIKTDQPGDELDESLKGDWGIKNHDTAMSMLSELKALCANSYVPQVAEAFKLNDQQAIDKYLNDTFVLEKDVRACSKQIENAFKSFAELVKLGIVKDEADFARIGDAGMNVCRLVYIARVCVELKYINEEEMWQYVDYADEVAHQSLTSWEDYGKSYVIGSCLWGDSGYFLKAQARTAKKLIEDPKSPWQSFAFDK